MAKIIAPVSSFEGAKKVVDAGANELYCGVRLMGMKYMAYSGRPASCCLQNYDELGQVVEYAHAHGTTVSLTANLPFMADLISMPVRDFIKKCLEKGIDALIIADIGTLLMVKKMGVQLPIYAGSFMVIRNDEAIKLLKQLNVSRVIAPPDTTIDELSALVQKCGNDGVEIEAFVHGENCSNVGGNCYLLHSHRARDEAYRQYDEAKVASIAQIKASPTDESFVSISKRIPCLFYYDVYELDGDELKWSTQTPIMDAFSFCSMCSLSELLATGVAGLKIVGRCQPIEYQAHTTKFYHELVDLIESGEEELYRAKVEEMKLNSPELKALCEQQRCYYSPFFANMGELM